MAGCGSGGQPSSRRAERMGFVGWVTAPGPRQYRSAPCVCVYVDTLCRRAEPQPPPGGAAAPWGRCALPEPCRPQGKWARCDGMRNGLLRAAAELPRGRVRVPVATHCHPTATTQPRPWASGPGGLQRFLRRGPQPRRQDSCVTGAGGMPQ